jgi:hypothetical protein
MPTTNSAPYEVFSAPFVVYYAPVGEAFPLVDVAPAGNWTQIGTSGVLNYGDAGVIVQHSQDFEEWYAGGDVGLRKVFRTKEKQIVKFTLVDITLEQYRLGLNMNAITTVAAGSGTAGYKKIGLSRGNNVAQRAILVRGQASPYGDQMGMQYEIPIAFQTGSPEVVYGKKGTPSDLSLEWTTVIDPNAPSADQYYGRLVVQHQAAL